MSRVKNLDESEVIFQPKPVNKKFMDLEGMKFEKLTPIGFAGVKNRKTFWYCKCDCGNVKIVMSSALKVGSIRSCGCLNKGVARRVIHGYCPKYNETKVYRCWSSMLGRCRNQNQKKYPDYGARGITICERWLESFQNFLDDMGEPPIGLTLDRIDVNGNYCPENCRWATRKEQANNRRSNHSLTYNGKTQNISQWAKEIGIRDATLRARIGQLKGSAEKALTTGIKTIK